MIGDDLPDDDHVVRYVKPTSVREDGTVDGSAFCLRAHRPDDVRLSVHWLECFRDSTKSDQLAAVRQLSRLRLRERGRFAELNVGKTKRHVTVEHVTLRFIHMPLSAQEDYEADPSHSEIDGLPPGNSPHAELIGDMIAESVAAIHPAVLE
jgi:hypothetical protein